MTPESAHSSALRQCYPQHHDRSPPPRSVETLPDPLATERAAADALRGELDALGIIIMDRPDGVDWKIRLGAP